MRGRVLAQGFTIMVMSLGAFYGLKPHDRPKTYQVRPRGMGLIDRDVSRACARDRRWGAVREREGGGGEVPFDARTPRTLEKNGRACCRHSTSTTYLSLSFPAGSPIAQEKHDRRGDA